MTFSRRTTLRTLAAIPFTAPLARAWASPAAPPAKKLVLVMQNNGTQQANFWPDAQMRSPILNALFEDANGTGTDNGLRAKTNLVKGVYVPYDPGPTNGNQHDMGFARMFTGATLMGKAGRPWGGGASVDQLVARAWDVDSLTLAVLTSAYEPFPKPGFDHRRSFSYTGPGTLKYPLVDPLQAYAKLFATGATSATGGLSVRDRLRLRRSVLDAVTGNLADVAGRVGADEKRKLDLHLTAIRDVERRLARTLDNRDAAVCAARPASPPDFRAMNAAAEVSVEDYIPALVDNMVDLMAAALTCGLRRVATLQLGYCGGKWGFAWKGIGIEFHDHIAHSDTSDGGSSAENTARVVAVNQYYASRVARLATALNAAPDAGGGTVLDNTLVVWANELGRGDHSQENVPIVMLGQVGAGRGIARGGRTIDSGRQVFNRLGCTILNLMDMPAVGFGDEATCGSFAGLTSG